jgi:hypothetical protein
MAAWLSATAALADPGLLLADPSQMMRTAKRIDFAGANAFSSEPGEAGRVLRSTPQGSASGIYQRVEVDGRALGSVAWRWRVDRLHTSADIRVLEREDFGATLFFIFGEPSMIERNVPTLAYTWTATRVPNGTFITSLRYESLRYIQLRGRADVGEWREERRDVAADFRRAFGREPGMLRYIAVFNDNDQTGEPVSAVFGRIVRE